MPSSDTNAYGSEHESVNLGKQLGQPKVSDTGRDLDDATSQSPQAQRHGGADPFHFDSPLSPHAEPGKTDDVNAGAWDRAETYKPMYEPKK
jgi:hypothetical protein